MSTMETPVGLFPTETAGLGFVQKSSMSLKLEKMQSTQDELNSLDVFFKPRNVAVIGATEKPGSVGRTVLTNLLATPFDGHVFPVNSRSQTVLGRQA